MKHDRPPLHVVAFYCCVLLVDVTSLRMGRLLERICVRYDATIASLRRRTFSRRATRSRSTAPGASTSLSAFRRP